MNTDRYVSPLSERYASKEMQYIFSPDMKFLSLIHISLSCGQLQFFLQPGTELTADQ